MIALALPLLAGGCSQLGLTTFAASDSDREASASRTVTVVSGDSLSVIAKRYHVSQREIAALNHLNPPYLLEPGQVLQLPGGRTYTVRSGDSLSEIARRHHIDTALLAHLNQIAAPGYIIKVGQVLTLPNESADAAAPPTPPRKPDPADANPIHGVVPGAIQTVPLAPPAAAASGPVRLTPAAPPARLGPASALPRSVPPKASAQAAHDLAVITPVRSQTVTPAPAKAATPEAVTVAPKVVEVPPPPSGGGRLLWPVKGPVISEYGGKPDGSQNDGVNIAAARGTPVIAADNGVVAYVGNELRSYGNLLLIRHASGLFTAYAHLDSMQVERGARIRRGQQIGTVGSSGKVSVPQIHFEVRRGNQAVDPGDYLKNRT